MATIYASSWTGSAASGKVTQRAYLTYTVIEDSATTYTVSVQSGIQQWNPSWGSIKTTCTLTNQNAVSKTVGVGSGAGQYYHHQFYNTTFAYTKGTSVQSASITGTSKITGGVDSAHGSSTVLNKTSTVTLYLSIPVKANYAIVFNANGGTGAPANQTKWYGESLTITTSAPTRDGYTFQGWYNNVEGTGTNYAGATYTTNAGLTLYAKWTANTYQVAYNANGGSGTMSNSTFTYDASGVLRTNTFTRTDYVFAGWATSASGAAVYADGASVTNLALSGTFNLYAVWKYAYDASDIQAINAYRSDRQGGDDASGEYGVISAHVVPAYMYSDLDTKAYTNTQVIASYRLNGSTGSYTQIGSIQTIAAPTTVTWTTSSAVFDTSNQYDILITARVYVNSAVKTISTLTTFISTAEFTIDFDADGESIGIFTIANGSETTGDVNKLIYLNGDMVFMLDADADSGTDYEILTALTALSWDCSPDI